MEKPADFDPIASQAVLGMKFKITDVFVVSALAFYSILAVLFPSRLRGEWTGIVLANGLAFMLFLAANLIAQRTRSRPLRFMLRTLSVQLALLYIYSMSLGHQLIFFPDWHDQVVIDLEARVLGVAPTVWVQRFVKPWLTEWMMFCYVFYVPVYPLLSLLIERRHGEKQNEHYLFHIAFVIILCTIGFMIFPVAGPMRHIGERHTVPLEGHFFTAVSELIRNRVHTPGGTIPSIHCASATIMWWMAYRYARPAFFILAPVILSLYVSTVYGRFHYLFDVFVGIAAALLVMVTGKALIKAWNRFTLRF
ncbi:MAG: phosphatase PAP2 family protein [Candidatus Aminicenantes bacterium]|nr:phosphatase PAP2 family protein [Candidatus Aminicenantes bacterium]